MCNEFKFKSDFFCPAKLSESDSSEFGVKNQNGHNVGKKHHQLLSSFRGRSGKGEEEEEENYHLDR